MAQTILIIDDDIVLVETLVYNLEQAGYQVVTAHDGVHALAILAQIHPDLILLDVMLPEMDGLEVCRAVRREPETATTPLIMLTARGDEIDKVVGLEVGADDYVTKPFGRRELLARIRTLLRRAAPSAFSEHEAAVLSQEVIAGPLRIDTAGRRVWCRGISLDLQPKQFDLLVYLVRNQGRVMTRSTLLHHIWGYDYLGDTRTIDVHIRWLREKLEEDASHPVLLQTVRGVGYVFR
jgi:DNA-binding response OmpR family regulator